MNALDKNTKLAINLLKSGLTGAALLGMMRALGFSPPDCVFSSVGLVWVGPKTVIKSHILTTLRKPKEKFRVPEFEVGLIGEDFYVVQPRCEAITEDQLQFAISIGYFDELGGKFDLHVNNLGIFDGRLRLFDW